MTKQQENEIISRILSGETDAFAAIVDEYQKNVYNLALKMTGNPEDAQDMSQEAFIKAFNSLSSFRGDSKFSVWLYRIVSNVCLDFIRARNRKPISSLNFQDSDGETEEYEIPDERALPEEELMRRLSRESVRQGMQLLPEDLRHTLLLREIEGLSYDEISEVLNIEPGTVKSRIFRARKKLCKYLIDHGNIPDEFASNVNEGSVTV